MRQKKHRYAAPAARPAANETARFIKRSITVRPDLDAALREIAGDREYSQIANEAFVLYIQARGIDEIVRDVESSTGPITAAEKAEAERRLADARRRAEQRKKARR
jgi:division protein CdvB (Snf7/Vps24/ESCRT-III family)